MQAIETLFSNGDELSDRQKRGIVVNFLKETGEALIKGEISPTTAAYDIAGLSGSSFVINLPASDPLNEIFTIAGELEVNPVDATDLTTELIAKIAELPE